MKTLLSFLVILISFSNNLCAQRVSENPVADSLTVKKAQNVYVEFLGHGITFSANYDTRFNKRRDGLGGRVGVGFLAADGNSLLSFPLGLNYLLGKSKHYFESGIGATYLISRGDAKDFFSFDDKSSFIGVLTFGYRLQPLEGGFNFRATFNPLFDKENFIPYFVGISLGYTF